MKYPSGLEEEWFQEVRESMQSLRKLYREIRVIIENVNEEVQKHGLEPMKPMPFRDRSDFRLENPEEWAFPHLDFPYKDKKWSKIRKPSHNDKELYLYIGFYLDQAEVHVGFWTDNATDEQLEEAKNKAEKGKIIEFIAHEEPKWLDLAYNIPLEELRNGKRVVQTLVDRLVKARDFANTLETFRNELGFRSVSQQKKRAR